MCSGQAPPVQQPDLPTRRRALIVNPGAELFGSDAQMLETVRALIAVDWDVTVISPDSGPLQDEVRAAGGCFEVSSFPVVRRAYLSPHGLALLVKELLAAAPLMLKVLREMRPDLLYVNTSVLPWWVVLGRLAGVPTLCHVHEAEEDDPIFVRRLLAVPLFAADKVVLNSPTSWRAVVGLLPRLEDRSVIVCNGVPDRLTAPVAPPADPPLRLACASRVSPRKGVDAAVQAVQRLREEGRTVSLEIAGTTFAGYEWYERQLTDYIQAHGLEDVVEFSGFVSPIDQVYDRCHVFLATSHGESFGNAVVEAQLAQRPVVATRVRGHVDTVVDGQTGLLVPLGDVDALAAAVTTLAADPELRDQIGRRARAEALAHFGIERYRTGLVSVIDAVVNHPTARRREARPGLRLRLARSRQHLPPTHERNEKQG